MRRLAAAAALLALVGCGPDPTVPRGALAGEYDADYFGDWWDADRDCQDTRNEILIRDLTDVQLDARGCLVLTGTLVDPYTGEVVEFVRGTTTSREVQIDHVYAKRDAWDDGASEWTDEQRRTFANDPANLLATKGSVNASKGARGPAEWLPPLETARCGYLEVYIHVAADYGLDVDDVDRRTIAQEYDETC